MKKGVSSSKKVLLKDLAFLSDFEEETSTLDQLQYIWGITHGYFNGVANRKLKETSVIVENIIFNVTVLAGQEAGYQLAAHISAFIADQSVYWGTHLGTGMMLDYLTGAYIGYLTQATALGKLSPETIQKASEILKKLTTCGATDVFSQGFASSFVATCGSSLLPSVQTFLGKHLVAKPALNITRKVSSTADQVVSTLNKPFECYSQAKTFLRQEIVHPTVQAVYRGPLRNFIKGYWGGIGGEMAKMKVEKFADKYINGKIKPLMDAYIDHGFPGAPVTSSDLMHLEDLTDNYSHTGLALTAFKELGEDIAITFGKEFTKQKFRQYLPNVSQLISTLGEKTFTTLQSCLNLSPEILSKILSGERLSATDFALINQQKYGSFSYYCVEATKGLVSAARGLGNLLGITWDHEEMARRCANILETAIRNPSKTNETLQQLQEMFEEYAEYPEDKEKIQIHFQTYLRNHGLFVGAIKNAGRILAQPTDSNKEELSLNLLQLIEYLLNNEDDPSLITHRGICPLHVAACQLPDDELCQRTLLKMLEHGADPAVTTTLGRENPLHLAAFHNRPKVIALLLANTDAGLRKELINSPNRNLQTPLHYALKKGHWEVAKLLVRAGASLIAMDANGHTPFDVTPGPLNEALDEEFIAILEQRLRDNLANETESIESEKERRVLLALGASAQILLEWDDNRIKAGKTPYLAQLLASHGTRMAHTLICEGQLPLQCLSPQAEPKDGFKILLQALNAQNPQHAEQLCAHILRSAQDVCTRDKCVELFNMGEKTTLLIEASKKNFISIVTLLLEGGANLNLTDKAGNTPLLTALQQGHYELAHYLLSQGANPLITNKNGENAANYWLSYYSLPTFTRAKGYHEFRHLMKERLQPQHMKEYFLGNDTNVLMQYCLLLFTSLPEDQLIVTIEELLKQFPDFLNAMDAKGNTLLSYCYDNNFTKLSLKLLEMGADPHVGATPAQQFLCKWNSYSNVSLLRRDDRRAITTKLTGMTLGKQ